jgi:hypothetical protein
MKSFTYNDMDFSVESAQGRWDISCKKADGKSAYVGAGLFAEMPESEVEEKARALVKSIFPVGIKIVGPDVTHPNFIYWDKDSSSFPK